jgi:hypothetical protein
MRENLWISEEAATQPKQNTPLAFPQEIHRNFQVSTGQTSHFYIPHKPYNPCVTRSNLVIGEQNTSRMTDAEPSLIVPPFPPPGYPQIGYEPFNLTPEEIEAAWNLPVSRESKEPRCSEYFAGKFSGVFDLYPQVNLTTPIGTVNRIDFIGIEKAATVTAPIGFEMKGADTCGMDNFGDFGNALAQCIDYSKSTIASGAPLHLVGSELRFVFLFPCPFWVYETDNRTRKLTQAHMWAQGELKLAAKFGVGAVTHVTRKRDWAFILGGHPAYWKSTGFTPLGLNHRKGSHWGSGR